MSQAERWQLGGNAPEVYETQLVPAIFGPWAPVLVAQAALRAGERALDVACGTGAVTRLVAPQVGPTGHVVGLDLNSGMLARARLAAARRCDSGLARRGCRGAAV
jgi:SAM-dependent methyltransferase